MFRLQRGVVLFRLEERSCLVQTAERSCLVQTGGEELSCSDCREESTYLDRRRGVAFFRINERVSGCFLLQRLNTRSCVVN
jgi:hypothetical protein